MTAASVLYPLYLRIEFYQKSRLSSADVKVEENHLQFIIHFLTIAKRLNPAILSPQMNYHLSVGDVFHTDACFYHHCHVKLCSTLSHNST